MKTFTSTACSLQQVAFGTLLCNHSLNSTFGPLPDRTVIWLLVICYFYQGIFPHTSQSASIFLPHIQYSWKKTDIWNDFWDLQVSISFTFMALYHSTGATSIGPCSPCILLTHDWPSIACVFQMISCLMVCEHLYFWNTFSHTVQFCFQFWQYMLSLLN